MQIIAAIKTTVIEMEQIFVEGVCLTLYPACLQD